MKSDDNNSRKKEAMAQVRGVEAILRRWDPIGVEPGETGPADEYDTYAPHIVSLVAQGCTVEHLSSHLQRLRTDTMGAGANPERDTGIASEIIAALRSEAV